MSCEGGTPKLSRSEQSPGFIIPQECKPSPVSASMLTPLSHSLLLIYILMNPISPPGISLRKFWGISIINNDYSTETHNFMGVPMSPRKPVLQYPAVCCKNGASPACLFLIFLAGSFRITL